MALFILEISATVAAGLMKNNFWRLMLNEDMEIIRSRGGNQMIMAKQELQEIEKYINHASIIIADGIRDVELCDWLAEAQLDAFCLEDQIAMYSIQDFNKYQIYSMKSAIGKLSLKKLTKNIQSHLDKMPIDLQIRAKLSEISRFTQYSNLVPVDRVDVMEKEVKEVKDFLRSGNDRQVLFIIGGQGSGKTSLMNKVLEDSDVKNQFSLRFRVNVSDARGLVGLLREVLGESSVYPSAIDELEIIRKVHDTFNKEENYLIVLDDVQSTGALNSLMHVLNDSKGKIICLAKKAEIAGQHEVVRISRLEHNEACNLLRRAAFPDYTSTSTDLDVGFRNALISLWPRLPAEELNEMEDILDDIQRKCQGNPWNLCTMGTLLQEKSFHAKWREIRYRMDGIVIQDNGTKRHHRRGLNLEDDKSRGEIRLAFLYCLAFPDSSEIPENAGIPRKKLIRLWMAEGFLQDSPRQSQEQEAEDLLEELTKRDLLKKKEVDINGKVLKYTVNKDIQGLASQMCKHQKFCRFLPEPNNGSEAEASTPTTRRRSRRAEQSHPRRKRALPERYRMVAVHGDDGVNEASIALKDVRLRCLLYFRTQKEHRKLELSFNRKYKLLRTLELQGARLDRLPSSIGYLICLRYLGLRGTQLEHLPSSCQRLKHLMCLDIRDTNITRLDTVSAFTEMRYLLLSNSFCDKSVHILKGLNFLSNLQTLAGAKHGLQSPGGLSFEQQLSYLQFIRKLSIKKVPSEVSKGICRQISKMEFLRSLTITCQGGQFDVRSLKIGKSLDKLKLGGDMGPLCNHRLSMMQTITCLYLWDSNLQEDPLDKLQGLRHLLILSLCNASTWDTLACKDGGYRRLRRLSIISMKNLIKCTFESGSMNSLEELVFAKCGKLENPPANLCGFQNLKVVHLAQMHSNFSNGIERTSSGRPIVKPHDIDMHFHTEGNQETAASPAATTAAAPHTTEGSQNSAEGSQTTTPEFINPPATEVEGIETVAVDRVTLPRGAKDNIQSTKSCDGAAKLMEVPQSPQDSLGNGKRILMQNSSKDGSDARRSETKDQTPKKFSAAKGTKVVRINYDKEQMERLMADMVYDMVSYCMDAVFAKACHSRKESMEQSKEIDLAVEEGRNLLARLREKPVVIQLPECVESYPDAVQNQPRIADRSISNVATSGVKALHMYEIETSICYRDNVCDLNHRIECEIEQLTDQKVVTNITLSNEERIPEGSQTAALESVAPPTTEGEGTQTTPPRGAKGTTQNTKSCDSDDGDKAGQTSSMTETRQNSEQAKEQPTKGQSSDVGDLKPRLQESELHDDDSAAKNASTAGLIQSSDSTPSTNQESSSRSRDDMDIQ